MNVAIQPTANQLLNFLSPPDRGLLTPYLERLTLSLRQMVEKEGTSIEKVYFPEDCILSVVGDAQGVGQIEVGMIGREGMTGLSLVLGGDEPAYQTFCQVAGTSLAIDAHHFRKAIGSSAGLREVFLRYVQMFMLQTTGTALSNAANLLPERLARWLLMCEDRIGSKHIPITHEFLSIMLGVERPGVTLAIQDLERQKLIAAKRGLITVLNRRSLEKLTRGTYGMAEQEYRRRFNRLYA